MFFLNLLLKTYPMCNRPRAGASPPSLPVILRRRLSASMTSLLSARASPLVAGVSAPRIYFLNSLLESSLMCNEREPTQFVSWVGDAPVFWRRTRSESQQPVGSILERRADCHPARESQYLATQQLHKLNCHHFGPEAFFAFTVP